MAVTVVGSTCYQRVSATSITHTAPANLAEGDLLLAFITGYRSLQAPAGWSVVADTGAFINYYSTDQERRLVCYQKDAVTPSDGGATFTFTHTQGPNSAHMEANMVAVRGGKIAQTAQHAYSYYDSYINYIRVYVDVLTAAENGELFVMGAAIAAPFYDNFYFAVPSGSTNSCCVARYSYANLASAYLFRNAGQANSGYFHFCNGCAGYDRGQGAITVRITKADVTGALAADLGLNPQAVGHLDPHGFMSAALPLGPAYAGRHQHGASATHLALGSVFAGRHQHGALSGNLPLLPAASGRHQHGTLTPVLPLAAELTGFQAHGYLEQGLVLQPAVSGDHTRTRFIQAYTPAGWRLGELKRWSGAAWVRHPIHRFDGSAWIDLASGG